MPAAAPDELGLCVSASPHRFFEFLRPLCRGSNVVTLPQQLGTASSLLTLPQTPLLAIVAGDLELANAA
jgi:hypothetical protein